MKKFKVIRKPVFLFGNLDLEITQAGYDLFHAGSINQWMRFDYAQREVRPERSRRTNCTILQTQLLPIFPQPFSVTFIVGTNRLDQLPKFAGVVLHPQMGEFMRDNVIDHFQRSHHQPPGEVQRASGTARSPACFCGRDFHLTGREAMSLRIFPDPLGDDFKRPLLVPADKVRLAPFPRGLAESESIVELQGGLLSLDQFQFKERAEEEKGFAIGILLFQSRLCGLYLLPRARDPICFLLDEGVDFRLRHAQRRADGERPITLDDQRNGPAFTADEFIDLDLHKIDVCSMLSAVEA